METDPKLCFAIFQFLTKNDLAQSAAVFSHELISRLDENERKIWINCISEKCSVPFLDILWEKHSGRISLDAAEDSIEDENVTRASLLYAVSVLYPGRRPSTLTRNEKSACVRFCSTHNVDHELMNQSFMKQTFTDLAGNQNCKTDLDPKLQKLLLLNCSADSDSTGAGRDENLIKKNLINQPPLSNLSNLSNSSNENLINENLINENSIEENSFLKNSTDPLQCLTNQNFWEFSDSCGADWQGPFN